MYRSITFHQYLLNRNIWILSSYLSVVTNQARFQNAFNVRIYSKSNCFISQNPKRILSQSGKVKGYSFFSTSHRSPILFPEMATVENFSENRLAKEKSPYLLQHKNNPVDWYPWGEDAFQKAKAEGKLIFLSIGYSTCHWCHVMERESFENKNIAALLNEHFVSIKVDREERPDVDRIYMTFVQATQGGGGWPLNVFLTPDLKPITGGTYFPPTDHWNRPGFGSVLKHLAETWKIKRHDVEAQSSAIMDAMKSAIAASLPPFSGSPTRTSFHKCFHSLAKSFDADHGGFETAPKFPQPVNLSFLLRASILHDAENEMRTLNMCYKTLDGMANGGIHDHIGFGFHRYSTDERWHVPHFEKMLYDNAQLLALYSEAFQVSKNPEYESIAREIVKYLARDMTDASGGIYSAEDADSFSTPDAQQKLEGAFYTWTAKELDAALPQVAEGTKGPVYYKDIFKSRFGVKENGNVDPLGDPHGELKNQNVLIISERWESTAEKFGLTVPETKNVIEKCRAALFDIRVQRPRPHLDDKMVAAWNGLVLSGLSKAAQAFQDEAFKSKAIAVGKFLHRYMYDGKRKCLLHSVYKGDIEPQQLAKPIEAFCEDYACVIRGLLDLYELCFDPFFLRWAYDLQRKQDELFWDDKHGGYFSSHRNDSGLLLSLKEETDGAEPSPNSLAAGNLLRLALIFDNADFEDRALSIFRTFGDRLEKISQAVPEMVSALMYHLENPKQVVIYGHHTDFRTADLISVIQKSFTPFKCVLLIDKRNADLLKDLMSDPQAFSSAGNMDEPTVHICRSNVCGAPIHDCEELARELLT